MQNSSLHKIRQYVLAFIFITFMIPAITIAQSVTYTYDDLNRLTSATYGETIINYVYDANGNITQVVTPEWCDNVFYRDLDDDGFGDQNAYIYACTRPAGFVENNLDCNDNVQSQQPGQTWYKDLDGDRVSDGTSLVSCTQPDGYSVESSLTALSGDIDDDGDGMTDTWETNHNLNPLVYDSDRDKDADGFTNLYEFTAGTDPDDFSSVPDFNSTNCSPIDLKLGFNLIGIACFPDGYSAYQMLAVLGSNNVISIQRFNPDTGIFETAGFDENGNMTGVDFRVVPGEGYFIYMKQAVSTFMP